MRRIEERIKKQKEIAIKNIHYWEQRRQCCIMGPSGINALEEIKYWRGNFDAWDFADYLFKNTYKVTYPDRMSVDDIIRETGYAKQTIYQKSHNGEIPGATKHGGRLVFDTERVLPWIQNNKRTNNSKPKNQSKKK